MTHDKHSIRLLVGLLVALCPALAAGETNSALAVAEDSITADECFEHVQALADDVYEGRAAGSRGGHAAARYIIQQLEQTGITPAGTEGGFVQKFGDDCRNILALVPGTDPQLTEEVIVVGAHYDHVGYGNRGNSFGAIGTIHNGADDNASGASVLLETIEAFEKSGLRTRRAILFAFWDCEERGMVGSRYWIAHPTLPLERVKLAITLDMVGRLRDGKLMILGTRSGYGLRKLFSGTLPAEASTAKTPEESVPLWLDFSWELHENSDHWSFLERKIPIALVHTGLHSDYHRPSDDADKVNRNGMREIGQYLLAALVKAGNEDRLPTFRDRVRRESVGAQRAFEQPQPEISLKNWPADVPRPRLGIGWRDDDAEPGTIFLTRVVKGTPAAAAGLAVHDRIYELDGKPFENGPAFQAEINALLDADAPELTLLIERRGHIRTVNVKMKSSQERRVESQEPERSASGS